MAPNQQTWCTLPTEFLNLIFERLESDDILACSAVCVPWNKAFMTLLRPHFVIENPYLLLTNIGVFRDQSGEYHRYICSSKRSCVLFNPQTGRTNEIILPELCGRWFCSSSNGWLLTVGFSVEQNIVLLHPFTRVQVKLPPPGEEFRQRQYLRVITSSSPLHPDCIVVALHSYGYKLSFCKPGDERWTSIDYMSSPISVEFNKFDSVCSDITFHDGKFYVVDIDSALFSISFGEVATLELVPLMRPDFRDCNYLVNIGNDLFLVSRTSSPRAELCPPPDYMSHQTSAIYVFTWNKGFKRWDMVDDIGSYAILLGKNTSSCVAVANSAVFRPNCVYFLDDANGTIMSKLPSHDTGVFNLATRSIQRLCLPAPIWTSPLNWLMVESWPEQEQEYE